MKKVFRILVSIFLVVVLLLEVGHYTFLALQPDDMDVVTTTAEIVFSNVAWEQPEEWGSYWIYVRPVGKGNNEELLLFTVGTFTETESPFSTDPTKMPELAVGQIVEITHTYKMLSSSDREYGDERGYYVHGYEALSIKRTTVPYNGRQTILRKTEGWRLNFLEHNSKVGDVVTVYYVAKITYPMSGYIIYGDNNRFPESPIRLFDCYFVRSEMFMSRDMREKLESREVGYNVVIADCWYPTPSAFENLDANIVNYIELEEKATSSTRPSKMTPKRGENYCIYTFYNYHNGGSNSLENFADNPTSKLYYYVKLDSGSLKLSYDSVPEWYRYSICEISAEDGAKEGSIVSAIFASDWYLDVKTVGSQPVYGTLILSYVPLDEIDYDFEK